MRAETTGSRKYGTTFSYNNENANVTASRAAQQHSSPATKLDHCDSFGVLLNVRKRQENMLTNIH